MKKVWKALSAAAVAATLLPYRVEKKEENGEIRVKALLWEATSTPTEDKTPHITIHIGFPRRDKSETAEAGGDSASQISEEPAPAQAAPVQTPAEDPHPDYADYADVEGYAPQHEEAAPAENEIPTEHIPAEMEAPPA